MNQKKSYAAQRDLMVQDQIVRRGINDDDVLAAMRNVPRHIFVPKDQRKWAYADGALRIEHGQTISQPYIVALMTDMLKLKGDETVLEVGTGSGYQAAILAQLTASVHTVERHEVLTTNAAKTIESLGIKNIYFHCGDGSLGLPALAPFQAIMVTAAAPNVPQALFDQLDDGGRLVIPVGEKFSQTLELWHRHADEFKREVITLVAFVPLIGEQGWDG